MRILHTGLLVTIHDFLDSNPEPEESEIKEAISETFVDARAMDALLRLFS